MRDVKNLNIWKVEEKTNHDNSFFMNMDITDLNLSVRSFNCLKRAGCHTVQDILERINEDDGQGLRKIRNLGSRSENEILEKIEEYKKECAKHGGSEDPKKVTIIRPAKKIWDREIEEFHLSNFALNRLKSCGISTVGDLYATNPKCEPGWYAVRELFEKIPSSR